VSSQTVAVWSLIALALLSANLPFLNERVFMLFVWRHQGVPATKPFWLRLLELFGLYGGVVQVGRACEWALTERVWQQGWQFYVVTLCLFLILAFPGFVRCYLYRASAASDVTR
jgi:hypothetical protein